VLLQEKNALSANNHGRDERTADGRDGCTSEMSAQQRAAQSKDEQQRRAHSKDQSKPGRAHSGDGRTAKIYNGRLTSAVQDKAEIGSVPTLRQHLGKSELGACARVEV